VINTLATYQAGLGAIRPGKTFGEVVAVMEAPLKREGAWNTFPLTHSVNSGVCARPYMVGFESIADISYYKRFGMRTSPL
jgi:hypothetical protein